MADIVAVVHGLFIAGLLVSVVLSLKYVLARYLSLLLLSSIIISELCLDGCALTILEKNLRDTDNYSGGYIVHLIFILFGIEVPQQLTVYIVYFLFFMLILFSVFVRGVSFCFKKRSSE